MRDVRLDIAVCAVGVRVNVYEKRRLRKKL